jgi:hypothetical protein
LGMVSLWVLYPADSEFSLTLLVSAGERGYN